MNKFRSIILLSSCTLLLFNSCKDDDIIKRELLTGKEVAFSVSQTEEVQSRTWYGDPVTSGTVTAWPINWNTASMTGGLDKVLIFGPNAAVGRNSGEYVVNNTNTDASQTTDAIKIQKLSETGVQWGTSETMFYGFYPYSAVTYPGSDATVSGTFPSTQQANTSGIVIPSDNGDAYTISVSGDMSCCMMAGESDKAYGPETTEAINVKFSPLSTCLNINITGPKGNLKTPVNITSVEITSDAQISGPFTYNFATKEFAFQGGNNTRYKSVYINTLYRDENNVERGLPLYLSNQKINLQAFILPNTNIGDLKVTLRTAEGYKWTKTLNLTSGTNNIFAESKINTVTLPNLDVATAALDFDQWIAQLDPRIYISDLSLPGTTLSLMNNAVTLTKEVTSGVVPQVHSLEIDKSNVVQPDSIGRQFQSGIRVFQMHVWMDGELSDIDGKRGRIIMVDNAGNPIYNIGTQADGLKKASNRFTLYHVLKILQREMVENHGDEFCVLMLSDYAKDRATITTAPVVGTLSYWDTGIAEGKFSGKNGEDSLFNTPYTTDDLYAKLTEVSKYLANEDRGSGTMLPQGNITKTTTVNDVKDKIILKFQLNANAGGSSNNNKSAFYEKLNGYSGLTGSMAWYNLWNPYSDANVMYSPLFYGSKADWGYLTHNNQTLIGGDGLIHSIAQKYNTDGGSYPLYNESFYSSSSNLYDMWYIYSEQANVTDANVTTCETNIANVIGAINSTYNWGPTVPNEAPNLTYMTYVGGVASTTNTNTLLTKWYGPATDPGTGAIKTLLDKEGVSIKANSNSGGEGTYYVDETNAKMYVNFGWVLVNNVSLTEVSNPKTTDLSARIVQTVIQNNGQQKLLLHRAATLNGGSSTQNSQAVQQQGSSPAVNHGGAAFSPRKRK